MHIYTSLLLAAIDKDEIKVRVAGINSKQPAKAIQTGMKRALNSFNAAVPEEEQQYSGVKVKATDEEEVYLISLIATNNITFEVLDG